MDDLTLSQPDDVAGADVSGNLAPAADTTCRPKEQYTRLMDKTVLKATELAVVLGCCRRTIYRWNDAGEIPAPVKISKRQVRWRTAEVLAWLDAGCPRRERWEPMWRMSGQKGVRR